MSFFPQTRFDGCQQNFCWQPEKLVVFIISGANSEDSLAKYRGNNKMRQPLLFQIPP